MTRPRVIPVLLVKNGLLVRSEGFSVHQDVGNPMATVRRLSGWGVDELVLLDIGRDDRHDLRRDDLHERLSGSTMLDVLEQVARECLAPLTVGGGIRTLDDIAARLAAGADKCALNTAAVDDPSLVTRAAQRFGAQCVVVSIDAARREDGGDEVMVEGGRRPTGLDPVAWAAQAARLGAGEVLLNSVDRDGAGGGYDLDLVRRVAAATPVPVIACGGAGRFAHLAEGLAAGAAAAAAANIFHFTELSYPRAKRACADAGFPVRPVTLGSRWFPREPVHDLAERDARLAARRELARVGPPRERAPRRTTRWCSRCVYPSSSAVALQFDADGLCTGCRAAAEKVEIPAAEWDRRLELLAAELEAARSRDGSRHDCVIPVSGGKDSHFQVHVVKELGFRPLLVTYDGNNWTPAGLRNMRAMRERFGVDHVVCSPGVDVLRRLNRLGVEVMGDMSWHAHVGIMTTPVRVAAQFGIPLILWGEHGYADLGGHFSMRDFPEMTYRHRLEHFARGYEWSWFVGLEGLEPADMLHWRYPDDATLMSLGLRGLYLGNYVRWEANEHTRLVIDRYGFEPSEEPFDRTYRRMSNLDDMHENGVHDYLKWIKFGYGRCTDHVCKDIRAGMMSREEGVDLVRAYDHVKPRDLARWLEYTGTTEEWFDAMADTFRDPRVWGRRDGRWVKADPWDSETQVAAA